MEARFGMMVMLGTGLGRLGDSLLKGVPVHPDRGLGGFDMGARGRKVLLVVGVLEIRDLRIGKRGWTISLGGTRAEEANGVLAKSSRNDGVVGNESELGLPNCWYSNAWGVTQNRLRTIAPQHGIFTLAGTKFGAWHIADTLPSSRDIHSI
jgi:hypothetical protein